MITVVGAGPAGLAAAWYAARAGHEVTVRERAGHVGGMASSRTVAGLRVDHGSHRLHPSTDPALLADLRALLGDDLQERPRHGRIRVAGRWVGFPLRPADLVRHLPPRLALGAAVAPFRRAQADSYGEVIGAGLGAGVLDEIYAPYARKLWDADPAELAGELARRRVSAGSPADIVRKLRKGGGATFLYPRRGFGQISEAIADAAVAAGARLELGAAVERVDDRSTVLWTGPIGSLSSLLGGPAVELRHRAMLIVWLVLDRPRWTEFDAHYLPDVSHPVARLSEPRNYRVSGDDPDGVTVLCAEVPCWEGDDLWSAPDADLGAVVADAIAREGLPPVAPVAVEVARVPRVYPVYRHGFDWELARAETFLSQFPNLVVLGRQGLFVPDNTHHVLAMGRAAASCLRPDGTFDHAAWARERSTFRTNVVED